MLTKELLTSSKNGTDWDLSNAVLYGLCKKHPQHTNKSEVLAKLLIIGRTYAASVERRRSKENELESNFYLDTVFPQISESEIDAWFAQLRKLKEIDQNSIPIILKVHLDLSKLFMEISGLEKRSLASKYLHFHFPNLFFIFDSRAKKGLSILLKNKVISRAKKVNTMRTMNT